MFCKNCGKEIPNNVNFCASCGISIHATEPASPVSPVTPVVEDKYRVSAKDKMKGVLWLVLPSVILVLILSAYAINAFVATNLVDPSTTNFTDVAGVGTSSVRSTAGAIINVVLGFLGILTVIAMFAGIAIGIIYLTKKTEPIGPSDPRSGSGPQSDFPHELSGWNWGAAGLGWIWGVCNSVWLSFIAFIPYVGMIWWIVMGIKGNEWAWRGQKWESVEAFKATQKKWKPWGIVFFFIPILIVIVFIAFSVFGFVLSERRQLSDYDQQNFLADQNTTMLSAPVMVSYVDLMDSLTDTFAMSEGTAAGISSRYFGTSTDGVSTLEIIGDKVLFVDEATISVYVPADNDNLAIENTALLMKFLKNAVPGWTNSEMWAMEALLRITKPDSNVIMEYTTYGNVDIELSVPGNAIITATVDYN